jgi:hypothetical protein
MGYFALGIGALHSPMGLRVDFMVSSRTLVRPLTDTADDRFWPNAAARLVSVSLSVLSAMPCCCSERHHARVCVIGIGSAGGAFGAIHARAKWWLPQPGQTRRVGSCSIGKSCPKADTRLSRSSPNG